MPRIYVDFLAVEQGGRGTNDTQGQPQEDEGYIIPVMVPHSEVAAWLATYDGSDYSPSAADSRAIARVVLDALKRAAGA